MIATVAPTTSDVVTGTGLRRASLVMSAVRRSMREHRTRRRARPAPCQRARNPFVLSNSTRRVADLGGDVGVERRGRDDPRAECDKQQPRPPHRFA